MYLFLFKGHIEIISITIACNFLLFIDILFFNLTGQTTNQGLDFSGAEKELKVQIKLVYLSFE